MARFMLGRKPLFLLEMMKMITAPTWNRYCSCLHARKAHRDAALIIEMLYRGYHHIENSSISKSRRRKREKAWCCMKEKESWPLIETRAMFNFNRTSESPFMHVDGLIVTISIARWIWNNGRTDMMAEGNFIWTQFVSWGSCKLSHLNIFHDSGRVYQKKLHCVHSNYKQDTNFYFLPNR